MRNQTVDFFGPIEWLWTVLMRIYRYMHPLAHETMEGNDTAMPMRIAEYHHPLHIQMSLKKSFTAKLLLSVFSVSEDATMRPSTGEAELAAH